MGDPVPPPRLPRPGGHREDLIYITFGSEIPAMPMYTETARAAVAAARATGCQMLLALGSADPAQLGDLSGVEVGPGSTRPRCCRGPER